MPRLQPEIWRNPGLHAWRVARGEILPIPWEQRFWAYVDITPDCWLWTGGTRNGYGRFWIDSKIRSAHHVTYEWQFGLIPPNQELHHLCHNPACVNPLHLKLTTRKQHRQHHLPTHCPRGHPYEGDNIVWLKKGARWCRTCKREEGRRPGAMPNGTKTHCPQGHAYDAENTVYYGPGSKWRICRSCRNRSSKEAKRRARAKIAN